MAVENRRQSKNKYYLGDYGRRCNNPSTLATLVPDIAAVPLWETAILPKGSLLVPVAVENPLCATLKEEDVALFQDIH